MGWLVQGGVLPKQQEQLEEELQAVGPNTGILPVKDERGGRKGGR